MSQEKYLEDLRDIKDIMQRSTRFISLSGLSGIFAGLCAMAGAYMAHVRVFAHHAEMGYRHSSMSASDVGALILIAALTLVLAISGGIYFTAKESRKRNQKLWDRNTRLMLSNLAIPLATGGLLCLTLLAKGFVGIVAPLTLVFYGLALVNASKYTLPEIRWLGITEIILGLIAIQFIGAGLVFWILGFGLMHIAYGTAMYIRYKS